MVKNLGNFSAQVFGDVITIQRQWTSARERWCNVFAILRITVGDLLRPGVQNVVGNINCSHGDVIRRFRDTLIYRYRSDFYTPEVGNLGHVPIPIHCRILYSFSFMLP